MTFSPIGTFFDVSEPPAEFAMVLSESETLVSSLRAFAGRNRFVDRFGLVGLRAHKGTDWVGWCRKSGISPVLWNVPEGIQTCWRVGVSYE